MPEMFDQVPVVLDITDGVFSPSLFEELPFSIPKINKRVEAPIISIERQLEPDDIAKTINLLVMAAQLGRINEQLGIENNPLEGFTFLNVNIADVKEHYIEQDLYLLVDLVDRYFDHELKRIGVDLDNIPDNIIQIVEFDFTMIDLCPGDTKIHYKLYTKRGIGRRCTDEQSRNL